MPHSVFADSCDPVLTPFPGSDLGYVSHGNRCEGFYISNVSSGTLELVSILHGTLDFEQKPHVVLEVSAPDYNHGTVNIRAVGIPLKTYYRMDTTVSPGKTVQWPIGDVVIPGRLSAQRLGVFGWVGTENEKTFVPLKVTQTDSTGQISDNQKITLIVRSSTDVDSLVWRHSSASKERCSKYTKWEKIREKPVNAGWPVAMFLPEYPSENTNICMEIAAKEKNADEWLVLSIRVWRPGSP